MIGFWGRWATARRPRRCRGCDAPIFRHRRYWSALMGLYAFCAPFCATSKAWQR